MKTKLTSLLLLIALITPNLSFGQSKWQTPFTKTTRNELGKREYKYPNPKFGKSSVTIGYGYMPISGMDWWSSPTFKSIFPTATHTTKLNSHIISNIGAINLAYANQITPWLELQVPIIYSYSKGVFQNYGTTPLINDAFHESWFSIMPNVKISWAFSDLIHIYSRIGIGFSLNNRYENFNAGLNHKLSFAWQFSPIGFEIGRRACFFIEGGLGQMGVVSGGVKFRFNKATTTPDGKKREVRDWHDTYLR